TSNVVDSSKSADSTSSGVRPCSAMWAVLPPFVTGFVPIDQGVPQVHYCPRSSPDCILTQLYCNASGKQKIGIKPAALAGRPAGPPLPSPPGAPPATRSGAA